MVAEQRVHRCAAWQQSIQRCSIARRIPARWCQSGNSRQPCPRSLHERTETSPHLNTNGERERERVLQQSPSVFPARALLGQTELDAHSRATRATISARLTSAIGTLTGKSIELQENIFRGLRHLREKDRGSGSGTLVFPRDVHADERLTEPVGVPRMHGEFRSQTQAPT